MWDLAREATGKGWVHAPNHINTDCRYADWGMRHLALTSSVSFQKLRYRCHFYVIPWDLILFITLLNVTMRMRFDGATVLRTESPIKFHGRWHDIADQLSDQPKRDLPLKHTSLKYLHGYHIASHGTMMSFPRHIQSSWQSNWPKSNCRDYPHNPGCGHG